MATASFCIQSKSSNAPIWMQLSAGKQYKRKIGVTVDSKKWSKKTKLPAQDNPLRKNLVATLKKLQIHIQDKANEGAIEGKTIDGNWLSKQIDIYFKRIGDTEHSDLITDVIALKIKEDIDLGKSRRDSYKAMSNIIKEFQTLRKTVYKIKDIDTDFAHAFFNFMLKEKKAKVQTAYAYKKLGDLKVICNFAKTKGILVSPHYEEIKSKRPKNEHIIFLNREEILQIKNTVFSSQKLKNVQQTLLFACEIGQRYGDLMTITKDSFKTRGGIEVLEVFQSKTQKWVTIPVTDEISNLTKERLPNKISLTKFNQYVKEVCKEAEINTMVIQPSRFKGEQPKWTAITSHVCRRSFCTNADSDGVLSHEMIRYISGHSSVASLLNYIGKNDIEIAKHIVLRYNAVDYQKENAKLKTENKRLKTTIATLQKEIKRLSNNSPLSVVS